MIKFHNIKWKNLLSTGNVFTEISLDTDNLTLITGQNGAGKTTLLDAICYVLYKKPYRKINLSQLVNSINKKDLLVEIEFSIGKNRFLVRRGEKPKVFEIFKNEELINQEASTKDYQEILEKSILKMNYKAFCQVVILGSTAFVPFMQLPAGNRREIIEDILDLQVFSTMNSLLKERIGKNKNDETDVEHRYDLVTNKLAIEQKNLLDKKEETNELLGKFKDKITRNKKKISELKSEAKQISSNKKDLEQDITDEDKIDKKISKLKEYKWKFEKKISHLKDDSSFYHDNENCPTCSQLIDASFKEEKIKSNEETITETEDALNKCIKELNDADKRKKQIESIKEEISQLNLNMSYVTTSAKSLLNEIEETQNTIADIEAKQNESDKQKVIDQYEKELETIGSEKKQVLFDKKLYSIAQTLLKDNGIKARIIKQYIPVINELINKYLTVLGFFVKFELSETFEETIKSRHRDAFSYTSFSEGEKTRINLSILFTWRQIAKMRNSASTNLLIFDEVLDSSTDKEGIEAFFDIITKMDNAQNVVIISHTQDMYEDKFDRSIRFEKVKNFSRIQE